jgi:PKD repeat protein
MYRLTILLFLFCFAFGSLKATNAPVSTIGNVATSGTTITVPITAINFTNIASGNLEIHYNASITTVTGVTTGPLLGGGLTVDLSIPGIISLGWYTFPGKTLVDGSVLFNIACSKVIAGISALTWNDVTNTCFWYNGNYNELNDSPTSTYYINGSVTFSGPLVTDFSASNTAPPKNTTVQFTDLTTGGPTNWAWSFSPNSIVYMNGTGSTSQNPQVQFTSGGLYTVTLTASNSGYSDTKVKTGYILAGTSGLWTGSTSSVWSVPANWDNLQVPGSSSDIVVPASCTNWPVFVGDLTVGVDCRSLKLSSPNSQITVNGNLVMH